jgi:hypothetical protein
LWMKNLDIFWPTADNVCSQLKTDSSFFRK